MLDRKDLEALAEKPAGARRKNRTISLNDENYEQFQDVCKKSGLTCSKVIDAMIVKFLESFKDSPGAG